MDLVVGVDLATADVRAVAADGEGHIHAESRMSLPPPRSPRPGWSEQDAAAWWPAVATCLGELTGRLGSERTSVLAVSVCATSGTVVALDDHGDPRGLALTYADQRAQHQAEVAQAADSERWTELGLRVQPTFGLPKWAWLLTQGEMVAGVAGLAHAPDLVVSRLVGRPAPVDWSHALKSGYDPMRGEWAGEALAALGIPLHLLPEVLPPTTSIGPVATEAARATGLPTSCEVRLGMTDACASQLAAGAERPGRFVSVLGTTLVVKGVSRDLVADPTGAVYSHRHPQGWWLPGGASNTGGSALKAAFSGRDLCALDGQALSHGPARRVTYPLVGQGERFPFVASEAEGFVLEDNAGRGDDDEGDEIDRYRSTLEGVAFVERLGYDHLAELGAPARPPLSATGAGSGSRAWTRVRATVMGIPLLQKPGATTALGACILAAAGTLHPDLSAAGDAMAVAGERVEPVEAERDALDASYERFVTALVERGWLGSRPA